MSGSNVPARRKQLRAVPTTDALLKRIRGLIGRELDSLAAYYDAREAERAAAGAPEPPAERPSYPRRRPS